MTGAFDSSYSILAKFKSDGKQPRVVHRHGNYILFGGWDNGISILNRDLTLKKSIELPSEYSYCMLSLDDFVYVGS